MHRSMKHLRDLFIFQATTGAVRSRCKFLIFDTGVNRLSGPFGLRARRRVFLTDIMSLL